MKPKSSLVKRILRGNRYKRKMPYSKDLIRRGLMDASYRPFIFGKLKRSCKGEVKVIINEKNA